MRGGGGEGKFVGVAFLGAGWEMTEAREGGWIAYLEHAIGNSHDPGTD